MQGTQGNLPTLSEFHKEIQIYKPKPVPSFEVEVLEPLKAKQEARRIEDERIAAQRAAEEAERVRQAQLAAEQAKVIPTPPSVPQTSLGGGWAALRLCESGGNYSNKKNPTYRGAYQFSYATWRSVGGSGDPADASPAEQDMRAQMLYQRSGAGQWPVCGKHL